MSTSLDTAMRDKLAARAEQQSLRRLRAPAPGPDFCSNDYLGLARSPRLKQAVRQAEAAWNGANGSTGSRLISGNTPATEALEARIADYHRGSAALLFSSGYAANTGLLACLAGAGDTLITDELIHASMIDGARLSRARRLVFRHNDLDDLEAKLRDAAGNVVIAVESLYSMDGDIAPLVAMQDLADRYGAALVVDEAHSNGVYGPQGRGSVVAAGLEERVFARVCTFGKALGHHGAAVVGSETLRAYLVNFARPFIYSTAPPPASLAGIDAAYTLLPDLDAERARLFDLITQFREATRHSAWQWLDSASAIQSVVIPGNRRVRAVAAALERQGLWVVPIVAPTVPAGFERIRVCLHAHNTPEELQQLLSALNEAGSEAADP